MAEISLILSSPATGSAATAVAISDGGTGVGVIPPQAISTLLTMRDQIVQMMAGAPRMSPNDLKLFARSMGKVLFGDDIGLTVTNATQPPLITKIIATTQELKAIPWEYAALPGVDPPQLTNSVVRLIPEFRSAPPPLLPRNGNFRVLLLSASPQNFERIPWPDIRDRLISVFNTVLPGLEVIADDEKPQTPRFLRIVNAATQTIVRRRIRDDDPHIVHFVGHGTDKGIALIDGQSNRAVLMDGNAFSAALMAAGSCRLVILSACDTANPQTMDPVNETIGTFAEQVVRNAVPAVIASQTVINDGTIATFCEGLYPELLTSGSIDLAMAAGRCNVAAQLGTVTNAAIEWGIPVLYRRLGAARLFV
ncbi:MAG: CHAT domain-containing protein [Gammaproteobacteria bacterium]